MQYYKYFTSIEPPYKASTILECNVFSPVRFEVYPIWHPGYVLNGGGGRVTRGVFAGTMRAIVGRMLAEGPLAERPLAGA